MTTNFPSSADAFTNPTSADTLDNPPHDQQHADINDAMEAVQTSLLDGAPLHIDDANERVGIGTTSPSQPLDVSGNIKGDTLQAGSTYYGYPLSVEGSTSVTALFKTTSAKAFIGLRGSGTTANDKVGIGTDSGDGLELHAGDNPRLVIDSSGNVGIGTTSPSVDLHISAGTSGDAELRIEADTDNNDEDDVPYLSFAADGGILEGVIGLNNNTMTFASSVTSNTGFDFRTGTTNYYTNGNDVITNTTSRVFIDSSGRVTMPYQPSFFAFQAGTGQTAGGSTAVKVSFNTIQHNIGSHYSSSTDRFTCPIAGEYLISWYGLGATSSVSRYYLRINGSEWNDLHVRGDGQYKTYERTVLLSLAVNDYLEVWYRNDAGNGQYTFGGNTYYTFSARLLG